MKFFSLVLGSLLLLSSLGCEQSAEETAGSSKEEKVTVNEVEVDLNETEYSKHTEAKKITYESDGLKVTGYMVKPEKIEGDLPLLIYNRGGNRGYGKINEKKLSHYLSYWAHQGYVVLATQYRGVDGGEGEEEFGGSDVNDVIRLQKVAQEYDFIDTENTFMLGMSRGGMMTYLAIKKGMDLDAAAVIGGITDVEGFYDARGKLVQDMLLRLVGSPDENKEAYRARSAQHWVEQLDAPLLILHGEADERVPVEQARLLADQLDEQNADFDYVEYPDGSHALFEHFEEVSSEIDQWFKAHMNDNSD
ncbi:prolyl oligopeptidase family serine peptidase [Halobacillus yeomjeoni]|uniref:alpha/beta hydrolase family protein n=1 Tax=Halobacillus yeomjeoni TaxID=311194 RepID=UPI001CD25901|nr:prolyl oligopeptidase family serine peptidase [Halobacillus yeomjeoni]MCA0984191.1 prolyl oligopeptidase family serine peptidase [Halobacillus yeomjeoni]